MTVKTLQLIANVHLTADFPVFDIYEILDEETGEALHDLDGVGAALIMGLRGRGLTVNDCRKPPEAEALPEYDPSVNVNKGVALPTPKPTPEDPRPLPNASATLYGKDFVAREGAPKAPNPPKVGGLL